MKARYTVLANSRTVIEVTTVGPLSVAAGLPSVLFIWLKV